LDSNENAITNLIRASILNTLKEAGAVGFDQKLIATALDEQLCALWGLDMKDTIAPQLNHLVQINSVRRHKVFRLYDRPMIYYYLPSDLGHQPKCFCCLQRNAKA
jgi:hypothetical protein